MQRIKFIRLLAVLCIVYSVAWNLSSHVESFHGFSQSNAEVPESYAAPQISKKRSIDHFPTNSTRIPQLRSHDERCALCFFGLPRSYKTMVLQTIEKNILIPNARHNCDIFVHYFSQEHEEAGRWNLGGKIDPTEILLLEASAKNVSQHYSNDRDNSSPVIAFVNETDAQFWMKRKQQLDRFKFAAYKDGTPIYFPWAAVGYTNSTLDNIVRQWHSIESAFRLMEGHGQRHDIRYTRLGMFRNDVAYLTPIDIYMLDKNNSDIKNYTAVPAFGSHPINDRMIYGPFEPIKIWSTKRFELIEERAKLALDPGYEMHSESFLNTSIFPVMEELGYPTWIHTEVCFVRTRAESVALWNDCVTGGVVAEFRHHRKKLVEEAIGRPCVRLEHKKYLRC